ncbi:MAG: hypothetical protein ACI92G_004787 [Candidatus Pelagisphaera sp.]|jgi:hypothetical protein
MLASSLNMNVSSLPQNRPIVSARHHPHFPQKVNPSKNQNKTHALNLRKRSPHTFPNNVAFSDHPTDIPINVSNPKR